MELVELNLPDELWVLIFRKYLDGIDTIRSRQVSKRFKFLIDRFCMSELLVYGSSYLGYLHYTDDREPGLWLWLSEFNFAANSALLNMFAKLKFLQMNIGLYKEFNLEIFNEFIELEKLYLIKVVISRSQSLRLPKLRVLSIRIITEKQSKYSGKVQERIDYSREPRLMLDSKVEKLSYHYVHYYAEYNVLELKNPECIEALHCRGGVHVNMLSLLQNLRVLCINGLELKKLSEVIDVFEKLKKLEEFHLDIYIGKIEKQLIEKLMSLEAVLGRKIKVFLLGISIPFERPISNFDLNTLDLRIANYQKLTNRVRYPEVEYDTLIRSLDQQRDQLTRNGVVLKNGFPICFFEKHQSIMVVDVRKSEAVDEERFLWFLSQCTRLVKLRINRDLLSESLLNRLPTSCCQLKHLSIYGEHSNEIQMDWSSVYKLFIYKLRSLLELEIIYAGVSGWPPDLALLFEQCRHLARVHLDCIEIWKRRLYTVRFYRKNYIGQFDQIDRKYNREKLLLNLNKIAEECKEYALLSKDAQRLAFF